LAAFDEVGEKLGRTAAACGFRWNSSVRKQYEAAVQIAKAQRQKRTKPRTNMNNLIKVVEGERPSSGVELFNHSDESITLDDLIRYLKNVKNQHVDLNKRVKELDSENKQALEELSQVRAENNRLKKQFSSIETDYQVVNDDYKTLLQIMDRARKMTLLTEKADYEIKPKFKMDENGNLERVER
ncbi:MAG: RsfA family transcriptional regulator, partial [Bacilli bacterium]